MLAKQYQDKRITKSLGGGGRTYKAINVRPEMSSVILEQGLFGTELTPLRWAQDHRGATFLLQGSLTAGAPVQLRPFCHAAACLNLC